MYCGPSLNEHLSTNVNYITLTYIYMHLIPKNVVILRRGGIQSNLFNMDTKGTEKMAHFTDQRRLYYRGRECMIFGISGTKRTVRN